MNSNYITDNTTGWSGTTDIQLPGFVTLGLQIGTPANQKNMNTLHTFNGWATIPFEKLLQISPEEYRDFKKYFSFDALKGMRFGQSFCNYFGIRDNLLFITTDPEWCNNYIEHEYVKKNPRAKNCTTKAIP